MSVLDERRLGEALRRGDLFPSRRARKALVAYFDDFYTVDETAEATLCWLDAISSVIDHIPKVAVPVGDRIDELRVNDFLTNLSGWNQTRMLLKSTTM